VANIYVPNMLFVLGSHDFHSINHSITAGLGVSQVSMCSTSSHELFVCRTRLNCLQWPSLSSCCSLSVEQSSTACRFCPITYCFFVPVGRVIFSPLAVLADRAIRSASVNFFLI